MQAVGHEVEIWAVLALDRCLSVQTGQPLGILRGLVGQALAGVWPAVVLRCQPQAPGLRCQRAGSSALRHE